MKNMCAMQPKKTWQQLVRGKWHGGKNLFVQIIAAGFPLFALQRLIDVWARMQNLGVERDALSQLTTHQLTNSE